MRAPPRAGMSLGFEYEFRSGACEVTRVQPDGPARAAGLRAGDRIVEVRVEWFSAGG